MLEKLVHWLEIMRSPADKAPKVKEKQIQFVKALQKLQNKNTDKVKQTF